TPPLSSTANNVKPAPTLEPTDPLLPDVPSFVSSDNHNILDDCDIQPPPYSKKDDKKDDLPDFDDLVKRLEALKRK
ncbi:17164_t:CDS:1, partial [Acaulospora morrowiae]